jgi:hypothetical protein
LLHPLTVGTVAGARPTELDHIESTGKTKNDAVYADVYNSYKSWVSEYNNPFMDGLFADDLSEFSLIFLTSKMVMQSMLWSGQLCRRFRQF